MSDLSRRLAELSPEKRKLLEARLRLQQGEGARTAVRPRDAASGPAPLSFAQERLWVLEQLGTAAGVYTMPYALRLRGRLDAEALRRALEELARRHEALRTVFAARDGAPVQVVLPAAPLALPVEEVEGEEGARRAAAEEALRPFDLERGPLLRARLLRLRPDAHLLLLVMHHAVSDAWSLDVLFREVCALYDAFARGGPSPLAPLPVQYADYAAWQREQVSGAALEEHLAFWRRELAGVPPVLDLPADRPRPPAQRFRGGRHRFPLPTALVERLREVAREEEATLYTVLLAGFQLLLARWSGEDAFVVGTPVTHRTRPELQALVGFFVNTLALRAELSGDPGFRELVRRVRRGTLAAFAHQDAPFDRVVEAVNPERDPSRSPLVQAMFSLRGALPAPHRGPELEVALEEGETGTAMFDLTLEVMEAQGGASAVLEYDADLFEPGTVLRMAEHFRLVLESAAAAPDRPLSELSLLSADERRRIESWTATAPPHPWGPPVHERVAAQARRRPGAVAVVSGAGRLTYGELLARADLLAADLRRRGVGPETVVGVRLGRSPELVVALLAVLRAGGAYLPIDPATPPDRVGLMLRDAGAGVVLGGAPARPHPAALTPRPPLPPVGEGEYDTVEGEDRSVEMPL
ncbi:MAG TPA: condensation domain-containing protein, partial [Longimicrobiaceae bacterium]